MVWGFKQLKLERSFVKLKHFFLFNEVTMSKIPPLPTTGELIKLFGLSAKQQLSQNFLLDLNITDKIARLALPIENKTFIEVGPGPGSLTRSVLKQNPRKLIVVEKDTRFVPALETIQSAVEKDKMIIERNDVLKTDMESLLHKHKTRKASWDAESDVKIVGNLPFNIATALLIQWMKEIPQRSGVFAYGRAPMILMFQKEVAMRITAQKGQKEYSRLSVMVQHQCTAKCLFDLDGSVFVPPPKVKATAVYIEPLIEPLGNVSIDSLEYVLQKAFGQRRKTIKNSITAINDKAVELLNLANVDHSLRPQDLSIEEWCRLANAYDKWPHREIHDEKNLDSSSKYVSTKDAKSYPWTEELKKIHDAKKKN